MTIRELDERMVSCLSQSSTKNSDYNRLAGRIISSCIHDQTPSHLDDVINNNGRYSAVFCKVIASASRQIQSKINFSRDFRFKHFSIQTLLHSYLMRENKTADTHESSGLACFPIERPQHLYMRIALEIFQNNLSDAFKLYDALSLQRVSHVTPTMLNAGTNSSQLSSCFQLVTADDMETLFDTLKKMALISKWSGGISLWLHNVRAKGSYIHSTDGISSGIGEYLSILGSIQNYANQGGKRPGAFAVYFSVNHDDIFTFLRKSRHIEGSSSAAFLKYTLWVPDLFMGKLLEQLRAEKNQTSDPIAGDWYLFSPDEAPGLYSVWGEEYWKLYTRYVATGKYQRKVKAKDIINEAFTSWCHAGVPYILFKDHINQKSNMQNIGTICNSNLCVTGDTYALCGKFGMCNLAAICLGSYVKDGCSHDSLFPEILDFPAIMDAATLETRALDNIIDVNFYPTDECRQSNQYHRPIGIGIMGLADVMAKAKIVYGSCTCQKLAQVVAAVIYYSAMLTLTKMAEEKHSYSSFHGSPASMGKLQPDLWSLTGGLVKATDWNYLRQRLKSGFLRNAYVTAYMSTATTSNIVGQNESFEPFTSNLYTCSTQAGEFFIINDYLINEFVARNIWDDRMRRELIAHGGSVQEISRVPPEVKKLFLTAREIKPKYIIQIASTMAPFVCQSMSMNLYLDYPRLSTILSFIVDAWKFGLKTGMYYCHTLPAASTQQTSIVSPSPSTQDKYLESISSESVAVSHCESCIL
ncbi:ribonucleoside-diphosphate reductase large subunit [Rhizophagus diaphanus]|nr:ribonucleoside-diphosphate reductase large subunit [Rhizophagus diaphanus] [Rhizophagus sp. MUCL 43196]